MDSLALAYPRKNKGDTLDLYLRICSGIYWKDIHGSIHLICCSELSSPVFFKVFVYAFTVATKMFFQSDDVVPA